MEKGKYSAVVKFMNGKEEKLDMKSVKIIDCVNLKLKTGTRVEPAKCPFLEVYTEDDKFSWIPLQSIQRMEFEKKESDAKE